MIAKLLVKQYCGTGHSMQHASCHLICCGLVLSGGLPSRTILCKDGRVDLGLATDWYSVFLILDPIWRFVVVIVY